jgi:hypothetical protein
MYELAGLIQRHQTPDSTNISKALPSAFRLQLLMVKYLAEATKTSIIRLCSRAISRHANEPERQAQAVLSFLQRTGIMLVPSDLVRERASCESIGSVKHRARIRLFRLGVS